MKIKTSARLVRINIFFLVFFSFQLPVFGMPDSLQTSKGSKGAFQVREGSAAEKTILENEYRITFEGVTINQEGESTWQYFVEELPDSKDLSFWILELPECAPVLSASPSPWEAVFPDPSTHLYGIRWDTTERFQSGHFSVTVKGQWGVGTTRVAAKGRGYAYGEISGPDCIENNIPQALDDYISTQEGIPVTINVLSNDADPDGDKLSLVSFQAGSASGGTVERQDNGTPGDERDDSLKYTPPAGFVGEDRFVYTVSDGILSGEAAVIVTVQEASQDADHTAPTLLWVSPVAAKEVYDVGENETIVLEVDATDDRAVARVVFQRWDAVNEKYILIANLVDTPYRVELDSNELNPEWNQVYVVVIDAAGNQSEYQYIWLYKLNPSGTIGSEVLLFFPMIRNR